MFPTYDLGDVHAVAAAAGVTPARHTGRDPGHVTTDLGHQTVGQGLAVAGRGRETVVDR